MINVLGIVGVLLLGWLLLALSSYIEAKSLVRALSGNPCYVVMTYRQQNVVFLVANLTGQGVKEEMERSFPLEHPDAGYIETLKRLDRIELHFTLPKFSLGRMIRTSNYLAVIPASPAPWDTPTAA